MPSGKFLATCRRERPRNAGLTRALLTAHNETLVDDTVKLRGNAVQTIAERGQPITLVALLQALDQTEHPLYEEAVRAVLHLQNQDGGFSHQRQAPSQVGLTAMVLEHLGRRSRGKVWVQRAVNWLLSHQRPDGGFSESPQVYVPPDHPLVRPGVSCLAPTSDVIVALVHAGAGADFRCHRALEFLLTLRRADGTWYYWRRGPHAGDQPVCAVDLDYPLRALDAVGDTVLGEVIALTVRYILSVAPWDWIQATAYLPCLLIARAWGVLPENQVRSAVPALLQVLEAAQCAEGGWPATRAGAATTGRTDPWLSAYVLRWVARADPAARTHLIEQVHALDAPSQ